MISKNKLDKKIKRKKNLELKGIIIKFKKESKKNQKFLEIANLLTKKIGVNTDKLKELDGIVVVPGKVICGKEEINFKGKVWAFKFSKKAEEKLKDSIISFEELVKQKDFKIIT